MSVRNRYLLLGFSFLMIGVICSSVFWIALSHEKATKVGIKSTADRLDLMIYTLRAYEEKTDQKFKEWLLGNISVDADYLFNKSELIEELVISKSEREFYSDFIDSHIKKANNVISE